MGEERWGGRRDRERVRGEREGREGEKERGRDGRGSRSDDRSIVTLDSTTLGPAVPTWLIPARTITHIWGIVQVHVHHYREGHSAQTMKQPCTHTGGCTCPYVTDRQFMNTIQA